MRSGCRPTRVLQDKIGHLLKRPVGRPPHEVRRYYASFSYQAQSWNKPRHVVAKVEWHPGELYPRVGFNARLSASSRIADQRPEALRARRGPEMSRGSALRSVV